MAQLAKIRTTVDMRWGSKEDVWDSKEDKENEEDNDDNSKDKDEKRFIVEPEELEGEVLGETLLLAFC